MNAVYSKMKKKYESLETMKSTPVTDVETFAKCGTSIRKWAECAWADHNLSVENFETNRVRYTKINKTTVNMLQVVKYLKQCMSAAVVVTDLEYLQSTLAWDEFLSRRCNLCTS